MKNLPNILAVLMLVLLILPQQSFAQREVKSRKRTTVVIKKTPRSKIVYVSRRPKTRTVRVLPRAARVVRHGQTRYYVYDGIYYKKTNQGYAIVRAPLGMRVARLPANPRRLTVGGTTYYFVAGSFYQKRSAEYVTVAAPVGAMISQMAPDIEKISIDGEVYYEYADVIYERVTTPDGVAYRVVGEVE